MIKAITFLVTALVNIGIGAVLFFILIISLNGFTGKQAEPGLVFFTLCILLVSLASGVLSFLSANYLAQSKSFNSWLAALLAITVFVIVGAAVNFVGAVAAVFLASAMR